MSQGGNRRLHQGKTKLDLQAGKLLREQSGLLGNRLTSRFLDQPHLRLSVPSTLHKKQP